MHRHTLIAWWMVLGGALWLSSLVVSSHPAYGVAAVLTALVFAAVFVARPHQTTEEPGVTDARTRNC
jgi:hypothetical protein